MIPHLGHVELPTADIGMPSGDIVPDRTDFKYELMCIATQL